MLPDFGFSEPISVEMAVLEIQEDRMPAFRVDLVCRIRHPTGEFAYSASDIWISTEAWCAFAGDIGDMARGRAMRAELQSMGKSFAIALLANADGTAEFSLMCSEPDQGLGGAELAFHARIHRDIVAALARRAESFPTWW